MIQMRGEESMAGFYIPGRSKTSAAVIASWPPGRGRGTYEHVDKPKMLVAISLAAQPKKWGISLILPEWHCGKEGDGHGSYSHSLPPYTDTHHMSRWLAAVQLFIRLSSHLLGLPLPCRALLTGSLGPRTGEQESGLKEPGGYSVPQLFLPPPFPPLFPPVSLVLSLSLLSSSSASILLTFGCTPSFLSILSGQ